MAFRSTGELAQTVSRLKLVEPEHLDECLAEVGGGGPDDLLRLLEKKHYVTSYQASVLGRGRTDGLVLGGYKLMYKNASGSFARVYRACAIADGRMLGLKVLRDRWAKDPRQVAQFRREAELCRRLRHRNIVPIYEIGNENGFHFFTMEFVEGGNLRDFLRIRGKLSPVEATRCTLEMAEGLDYALSMGCTHRDLKLTNVLMGTDGVAKLVDFGLAGDYGLSGSAASDADGVERALEYATLEKGTNAPDHDPRSDLYFLGAIYYELLTGTPPYPPTSSRDERKRLSRYTNIRPLKSVEPNIPPRIAQIAERLMKVNPDLRYQKPSEVVADLRSVLAEMTDAADERGAAGGGKGAAGEDGQPVIMFVESRHDQQNVLREYFSRRGARVLMVTDPGRALVRLKSNPPDCLVLIGQSVGDEIGEVFAKAVATIGERPIACVAVLAEEQGEVAPTLQTSKLARVLVQPIKLRELRDQIARALRRAR
ncbi:MAG: protein kinase [Planctomycetes bacterium]|nr:protein kinase [Planctomycetota bacterium]